MKKKVRQEAIDAGIDFDAGFDHGFEQYATYTAQASEPNKSPVNLGGNGVKEE